MLSGGAAPWKSFKAGNHDMMPLTDAQSRALDFLQEFQNTHGYSPTRRELADGLSYKSENGAQEMLKRLERLGAITMATNQARSIRILASLPTDEESDADLKCPMDSGSECGSDGTKLTEVILAITERDPAKGHKLLLAEAEAHADEALASLIPHSESAQFLFRQMPFVSSQLRSIYVRCEGDEASQEKTEAAIRILMSTFLPYTDFMDNKADTKTATGKTFRSESEICRFFDAIQEMHAGAGDRYFEFIRHHPIIKKSLGSDLRSRQQFYSRTQTDLPLRQQAV